MKKSLFIAVITILMACETAPILFKGPYHVRFTNTSESLKESYSSVVKIEIHNAGPELEDDITINYRISGDAREGIDYEIVGTRGQVKIKAGKYLGYIELRLLNNANNIIRKQNVVLTLTNVSLSGYDVGQGEGGIGKQFTLTIIDDCILGGTYSGTQSIFDVPVEGITVTSSDCQTYIVSDWDINIFDYPFDMNLKFIDKGDNTITIPKQEQPELTDMLGPDFDTVEGIGSVNPITKEINLVISLTDFDPPYTFKITLTPQ